MEKGSANLFNMKWAKFYTSSYNPDGTPWFPQKLSLEFLKDQRRSLGSYIFANQYLNEVIPRDDMVFKPEWKRYVRVIPEPVNTYAFVDPAISLEDGSDYTGLVVIKVDCNNNWYIIQAKRFKYTPSEIVDLIFKVYREFKPKTVGIESVSYQKALIYMMANEMKRRNEYVNISEVKPEHDKSKEMRILALQPRFEWGQIYLTQGLTDFEEELDLFPRAKHDDLLDSLAYMDKIVTKPQLPRREDGPKHSGHPDYERNYIRSLTNRRQDKEEDSGHD